MGRLNGGTTRPQWHSNVLHSGQQLSGFGNTGVYNALIHGDSTNQGGQRLTRYSGGTYHLFHQGYRSAVSRRRRMVRETGCWSDWRYVALVSPKATRCRRSSCMNRDGYRFSTASSVRVSTWLMSRGNSLRILNRLDSVPRWKTTSGWTLL